MRALLCGLALLLLPTGCRDRNAPSTRTSDGNAAEAAAPEVLYPVVIEDPPQEVVDAAIAARAVSDAQDAECAFLEIDASLTPLRPDSLGCPRTAEEVAP